MRIKHFFITLLLCALCGCNSNPLRFAPTEAQKQNAALAVEATRLIRDNGAGAGAGVTEVAHSAALNTQTYFGLPAEGLAPTGDILTAAAADAAKRPNISNIVDTADSGLSLLGELALLFGFGGLTLSGKSLVQWVALLRQKAAGFEQTIAGNELLKGYLKINNDAAALDAFKDFQDSRQTDTTRQLVAVTRAGMEPMVSIQPRSAASDNAGT